MVCLFEYGVDSLFFRKLVEDVGVLCIVFYYYFKDKSVFLSVIVVKGFSDWYIVVKWIFE